MKTKKKKKRPKVKATQSRVVTAPLAELDVGRSFVRIDEPHTVGEVKSVPKKGKVSVFYMTVEDDSRYVKGQEYELDRTQPVDVASDHVLSALAARSIWWSQPTAESSPRPRREEPVEVYPKAPRHLPDRGNLVRMFSVGTAPFVLRDTKWKTIRQWAERCSDHYRDDGKFLTVHALASMVNSLGLSHPDECKVKRRLRAIYADDYRREKAETQSLCLPRASLCVESPETAGAVKVIVNSAERERRLSRAKGDGVDAWGFRLNTRSSRINSVITVTPKTAREIEEEANCQAASSHLSRLVSMGVVVKIGKGFALSKEEDSCRQQSQSEKSVASSSMRSKGATKSGKMGRKSTRERSTDSSRKARRDGSAKRRGRKA